MSRKLLLVTLAAVTALLLSCGEERGQAILIIASVEPVSVPFGDIRDDDGTVPTDTVDIELHNEVKNPNALGSLTYADIVIESITMSFTRTDGGTDKPATFRSLVSYKVPARGILTIEDFPIVPATIKMKFPISDLLVYGFERSTNFTSIRVDIRIEIAGRTVEGDPIYASGSISIEFIDWAG